MLKINFPNTFTHTVWAILVLYNRRIVLSNIILPRERLKGWFSVEHASLTFIYWKYSKKCRLGPIYTGTYDLLLDMQHMICGGAVSSSSTWHERQTCEYLMRMMTIETGFISANITKTLHHINLSYKNILKERCDCESTKISIFCCTRWGAYDMTSITFFCSITSSVKLIFN